MNMLCICIVLVRLNVRQIRVSKQGDVSMFLGKVSTVMQELLY